MPQMPKSELLERDSGRMMQRDQDSGRYVGISEFLMTDAVVDEFDIDVRIDRNQRSDATFEMTPVNKKGDSDTCGGTCGHTLCGSCPTDHGCETCAHACPTAK